MLRRLHIENYALIERLDIEWRDGFSVITGETGAGKSILLGALGLLCGERADSRSLKEGAARCVVEGEFGVDGLGLEQWFEQQDLDFDGGMCLVRRELSQSGRSRAFVNDSPVQLSVLKELGDRLVDIHSQHQNLLLGREGFQLGVLDGLADGADSVLDHYADCFARLRKAERELAEAEELNRRARDDEDYVRFQWSQLDEARLDDEEEQDRLEQEQELLEHAEETKQCLVMSQSCIESSDDVADVLQRLKESLSSLRGVEGRLPAAAELAERIGSCLIELKDVAAELGRLADGVEWDGERLQLVGDRLNVIYTLEKKHRVGSVAELIRLRDELDSRLQGIDAGDELLERLRGEVSALHAECVDLAAELSALRKAAAGELERGMVERLQGLGMPNVRFEVALEHHPDRLMGNGADTVTFLFSANKGGALQDVAHVASGGETARVMLALKSIGCTVMRGATIIFDEIDTGVSGAMAEKMARIMEQMGRDGLQVVSITHLPQIAARGSWHYKVWKEEGDSSTTSHIAELDAEARVVEIAHMLSGENLTDAAVRNARELLKKE